MYCAASVKMLRCGRRTLRWIAAILSSTSSDCVLILSSSPPSGSSVARKGRTVAEKRLCLTLDLVDPPSDESTESCRSIDLESDVSADKWGDVCRPNAEGRGEEEVAVAGREGMLEPGAASVLSRMRALSRCESRLATMSSRSVSMRWVVKRETSQIQVTDERGAKAGGAHLEGARHAFHLLQSLRPGGLGLLQL